MPTSDSNTIRLKIVRIDPLKATRCRLLKVLSVRVTVSREAPMNSPISSCVNEKRKQMPFSVF